MHVSRAFFSDLSTLEQPAPPSGTAAREVDIEDMTTFGASIFAFPGAFGPVRPYGGIGASLGLIGTTRPRGTFASDDDRDSVAFFLQEARTAAFATVTLGAQLQVGPLHLFGQGVVLPRRQAFLLNTRGTYMFEGGVRYNFGSAIERPQ